MNVLGVRLGATGHPLATATLAACAAVVWIGLTYGVPTSLFFTRQHDSVLADVNGSWLIWVVATQSLSIAASKLAPVWPSRDGLLAPAAVGMWSIGLVLYLVLIALIMVRWLTLAMTPDARRPRAALLDSHGSNGNQGSRWCRLSEPSNHVAHLPGNRRIRQGIHLCSVGV